jgi:hypothetical protein
MFTEARLLPTPAMTDASDLVLRMGRLVWDNPRWTPAHSGRAARRPPAALSPGPAAIKSILAAAHQAIDALALVAKTDGEAVEIAMRAGRLYVPTRSLPEDNDIPRPFTPAPVARWQALQEAYRVALYASIQAAGALDELTVATGAPSRALMLARAAASVQSHRRGRLSRPDDDALRDPLPIGSPFRHSRASTGRAGPVEQAIRDRGVSDPVILLRAAAIDNAAHHLIAETGNATSVSSSSDTPRIRQPAAGNAAQLAAQSFPHDLPKRPSADLQHSAQQPARSDSRLTRRLQ